MRVVFAGTPEFAAHALQAIEAAGHTIALVLTQPDRRAGRGMHLHASPVKEFALSKGIPLLQPTSLNTNSADDAKRAEAIAALHVLSQTQFDAMVVVAYGLIIPQSILDLAEQLGRHGAFNIHGSLLPRWRGAAPIQRAIASGDERTGITIMQMDAGLDTGDMVLSEAIDIAPDETSSSLHDRLADMGARLMVRCLAMLDAQAEMPRIPQGEDGMCYAEKIQKAEAEIDWSQSAITIDRLIRAFNPFPGASSTLNGQSLKFWRARPLTQVQADQYQEQASNRPGLVVGKSKDGFVVWCKDGALEVLEIQKPGGRRMSAAQWIQAEKPAGALQFTKATA
ncbi:methionyl-tRNA formyltransferase [Polynucleobacter sp.]|uniref:methionyl-tRNA formyltransferase n=1 Tax=Polynucleobacter sp. TaxID=2029855 RepID=UPI0027323BB2|nr:methionyl-tRNA formyltransferase [Polynucleobacter sp.]MDP3121557.1 methionyl-tRNA formyltransferase [Polynucleobacter sp.]